MATDSKQGGGHMWAAIGALAALVGAAGALLAGLAAAGMFEDEDASRPSPAPVETVAPTTTRVASLPPTTTAAAPTQQATQTPASRVDATLVYRQGATGCSPTFVVSIGDRTFSPTGLTFPLNDLQMGSQEYLIEGTVLCTTGAGCVATGSGVIDVVDGRTFEVAWQEIGFQQCDMSLS